MKVLGGVFKVPLTFPPDGEGCTLIDDGSKRIGPTGDRLAKEPMLSVIPPEALSRILCCC